MLLDMACLDHPTEVVLERFLLNHCSENELREVETHVLHCGDCVFRLEVLETEISALKRCLQKLPDRQFAMAALESGRTPELV